jgi:DNA phosphorothioation-associated putative methyltransferase
MTCLADRLSRVLLGAESGAGVLSSQVKIQNCFCHHELKTWNQAVLEPEAISSDIGIFHVFKDKAAEQQYLASRHRRAAAAPRTRIPEVRFEENREFLEPLSAPVTASGRLPELDEFPQAAEIESRLGSVKRAFARAKRVTGESAQGNWRTVVQDNGWDGSVLDSRSQVAQESPISQQLSWPRTLRSI